jgi:tartrate dehydratase beta subunit/fumarate hydratase class I family protein
MPEYFKNHPIYYAGPAKNSGRKWLQEVSDLPLPGRMDVYVDEFQSHGGKHDHAGKKETEVKMLPMHVINTEVSILDLSEDRLLSLQKIILCL